MTDFRTRIGKVTLKGGCHLVQLSSPNAMREEKLRRKIDRCVDEFQGQIGGFAFVMWGENGGTISASMNSGRIPAILIPELARSHLLAVTIESWTLDSVRDSWGG